MPDNGKLYLNASGGDHTQNFCIMIGTIPICGANFSASMLDKQMVGCDNFIDIVGSGDDCNNYRILIHRTDHSEQSYPLHAGGESCFSNPIWFTT